MATICGAIIARDAADTIERCLASLAWTDGQVVVVDDRTADATAEIAARRGALVDVRPFVDFARQRNAALQLAATDWVLFVDDDEVVTDELAAEIRATIESPKPAAGYWIPRKNLLFGRWVRHAGWSPDYQLRLLRRQDAHYREDRTVHELVDLRGEAGYLRNRLVHHNYSSLHEFLARQRTYAAMEAADMFRRGVRVKPRNYLLQPWRQFWRRYVTWQGYLDGGLGLLLSLLMGYYELRTYLELGRMWRCARNG
ncbi:MAG: glycosyltransferase family 2 protein [Sphingomonadaceae bacterium]